MQGQSCLLDTQTSTRLFDVVGLLGPWSPQGGRVLAQHGEGHTQILEWPSQAKLGQLPKHAWQWASETRLMANAPDGILWSDFPFEEVQILDTESDPWQLFHPIDNTAVGIRWRESLKRNEFVSWQPGLALEVAVRPDLARLQFQEWAWDPAHSSWAAMEGAADVCIQAWSHPLGHAQAQVRRELLGRLCGTTELSQSIEMRLNTHHVKDDNSPLIPMWIKTALSAYALGDEEPSARLPE